MRMCYNKNMKIRNCWQQDGPIFVAELWIPVDELLLQPWYQRIADTQFMKTVLKENLSGTIQIVYTLHLDTKTGEYQLTLHGANTNLTETVTDFANDIVSFIDFVEKYVVETEEEKNR